MKNSIIIVLCMILITVVCGCVSEPTPVNIDMEYSGLHYRGIATFVDGELYTLDCIFSGEVDETVVIGTMKGTSPFIIANFEVSDGILTLPGTCIVENEDLIRKIEECNK